MRRLRFGLWMLMRRLAVRTATRGTVAEGNYYPDDATSGHDANDPNETFQLVAGTAVYGGFAGASSDDGTRDRRVYKSLLSGDIDANGVIDSNNAYHVVTGANDAVLDGFTISYGNGNDTEKRGAGIYCNEMNPVISNCVITDNNAPACAGLYCWQAHPQIENCFFHNNSGGGMAVIGDVSYPQIVNCVFSQNTALRSGGGMFNDLHAFPTLINCTFSGNKVVGSGDHCDGGGLIIKRSSQPELINCIIWGNHADSNGNEVYTDSTSEPSFSFCDINDCNLGEDSWVWDANLGTDGGNNIDSDPCFFNPAYPAGEVDGVFCTSDDGLRIDYNDSPCIDMADGSVVPARDATGRPRYDADGIANTGRCEPNYGDIGAYEASPMVMLMCWIDESDNAYTWYEYDDELEETYCQDLLDYRRLLKDFRKVVGTCQVPTGTDGEWWMTYTIEDVLPLHSDNTLNSSN